jgi:hypothetical protein
MIKNTNGGSHLVVEINALDQREGAGTWGEVLLDGLEGELQELVRHDENEKSGIGAGILEAGVRVHVRL